MNNREKLVAAWLSANGNAVHTEGGWPDFLCVAPDGEIFAVEVKSFDDKVRDNQTMCHKLLERAGIRTVVKFVTNTGEGLDWPEIDEDELMRRLDEGYRRAARTQKTL